MAVTAIFCINLSNVLLFFVHTWFQRVNKFRSCLPEKWASFLIRESWNKKAKRNFFEIIKSVIKYQWKILKLQKREFNKNPFNLRSISIEILRTLHGIPLTSTIVSIFQRAKLLYHFPHFLFLLLKVSQKALENSSVFTNASSNFDNFSVFVILAYLSRESFPIYVVNFEAVLSNILNG